MAVRLPRPKVRLGDRRASLGASRSPAHRAPPGLSEASDPRSGDTSPAMQFSHVTGWPLASADSVLKPNYIWIKHSKFSLTLESPNFLSAFISFCSGLKRSNTTHAKSTWSLCVMAPGPTSPGWGPSCSGQAGPVALLLRPTL